MAGRLARYAIAMALVVGAGSGCSRKSVVLQGSPSQIYVNFAAGASTYPDVLAAFGPPAEALPTQDGFAFFYRSYDIAETNLTLSYQGGKLAYSFGERDNQTLAVFFDASGRVQSVSRRDQNLDLGYGVVFGHNRVEEPFFEARKYDAISRRHYQSAQLTQQAALFQNDLPHNDDDKEQDAGEDDGDGLLPTQTP